MAWRHPEWPWALLAGIAWLIFAVEEMRFAPATATSGPATSWHEHGDHAMSAGWLLSWILMTVAMMVPAALPITREIGLHSLWSRRYRTGLIFIAAYVSVWAVFGAAAITLWTTIAPSEPDVGLVSAILLLTAAGWALTSAKRRHLKRCHRFLTLPSEGRAADKAVLQFGAYHARQCVAVCWPLMLVMIPAHTLLPMAGIAAMSSWERLARLPRLRVCAVILATVGTGILIAG